MDVRGGRPRIWRQERFEVIVKVSQASLQDLLATGPTTTDNGKLVINEEQWRGKEDLVEP